MMRKIYDSPYEIWGDDESHARLGRLGDGRWHAWINARRESASFWIDGRSATQISPDIPDMAGYATREEAEEALAAELLRRAGEQP